VIGKVIRGSDARRLLYYLYGPGKANEHTDPHLVAGFADPAGLEPARRPGRSRDFRPLAGLLAQPLAAVNGSNYRQPVWHCAVRAAPEDRVLSDGGLCLTFGGDGVSDDVTVRLRGMVGYV
jgi:hypothetical protein